MLLVAVAVVWLLLGLGLENGKLDAIRTGSTLGVGLGGVVVLWLAVRKQRSTELDLHQKFESYQLAERIAAHNEQVSADNRAHQRRVAEANERDATARRITDLYGKAVDQLGSGKAAVRLGGLYALERLAQDNPDPRLRQTIVNVLCSYLRMPYSEPQPPSSRVPRPLRRRSPVQLGKPLPKPHPVSESATDNNATSIISDITRQEREVRLTAQRILETHLRPGSDPSHTHDTFWFDIDLDLSRATLINVNLTHCRIHSGDFAHTKFIGNASFEHSKFIGSLTFTDAEFAGNAVFDAAEFVGNAAFVGTKFVGNASFQTAEFARSASFEHSKFIGSLTFTDAEFAGNAVFDAAEFVGNAAFVGTEFVGNASFRAAEFAGNVSFDAAKFVINAVFTDAEFAGNAEFMATEFADSALFEGAEFGRNAWFNCAKFAASTYADSALVRLDVNTSVTCSRSWPPGWTLATDPPVRRDGVPGVWGLLIRETATAEKINSD